MDRNQPAHLDSIFPFRLRPGPGDPHPTSSQVSGWSRFSRIAVLEIARGSELTGPLETQPAPVPTAAARTSDPLPRPLHYRTFMPPARPPLTFMGGLDTMGDCSRGGSTDQTGDPPNQCG